MTTFSTIQRGPGVLGDNARDRVAAVVLAAGGSERFGGGQKVCEMVGGEPMVRRVVRCALKSPISCVCIVVGHQAEATLSCLGPLRRHPAVMTINNPSYLEGIASSIRVGVAAVSQQAEAVMILLADMPGIGSDLMARVIETYKTSCARVCYPIFEGRRCHPVIFRKDTFPDLLALRGDRGGRSVVEVNKEWAKVFDLESLASQVDVDTIWDLEEVRKALR